MRGWGLKITDTIFGWIFELTLLVFFMDMFQKIIVWLDGQHISYRHVHHAPTYTSEESAQARGEEMKIGGKALLMKAGDRFCLFVVSAAKKVDSKKMRDELGEKKLRFASAEELQELTSLVPGCVPPFGHPILPFDLYLDESIQQNKKIAFNAGSLTDSLVMSVTDYVAVAQPKTVFSFSV